MPFAKYLFAAAAAAGLAGQAQAGPPKAVASRQVVAEYAITLAGIPLGQASLTVRIDGDRYESSVIASLSGLAGVLVGGEGKAVSKGRLDPEQPLPASFDLDATYAGVPIKERMALDAGIVRSVEITPKPEPRPDRIMVSQADRTGIVDPLSALIAPVTGAPVPASCDRILPVYDGTMRFDVKLSQGEVVQLAEGPYRGLALDCRARYVPVSGHRAGRKSVKAMADNEGMAIRLAPAGDKGPMLPLRITVDTAWGTAAIQATTWRVGEPAAAPVKGRTSRR